MEPSKFHSIARISIFLNEINIGDFNQSCVVASPPSLEPETAAEF